MLSSLNHPEKGRVCSHRKILTRWRSISSTVGVLFSNRTYNYNDNEHENEMFYYPKIIRVETLSMEYGNTNYLIFSPLYTITYLQFEADNIYANMTAKRSGTTVYTLRLVKFPTVH